SARTAGYALRRRSRCGARRVAGGHAWTPAPGSSRASFCCARRRRRPTGERVDACAAAGLAKIAEWPGRAERRGIDARLRHASQFDAEGIRFNNGIATTYREGMPWTRSVARL